jgi:hypothetical protein
MEISAMNAAEEGAAGHLGARNRGRKLARPDLRVRSRPSPV